MLKIGIVGSENTHASTFSGFANLPDENGNYPLDARVTMIWGGDRAHTEQVAEERKIPRVVDDPEEMIGKVDAVMVVPRRGSLHCRYALPFLKAGIPAWVDKPFTVDFCEAQELVKTAQEKHVVLFGGSVCKFSDDAYMLQQIFRKQRAAGQFISGAFNFSGDIASEYDGIYFYGSHAAELLLTVFGYDVLSVRTDVCAGNLVAIAKYRDFTVTINFSKTPQSVAVLYASKETVVRPVDISFSFRQAFCAFLDTLEGRRAPLDSDELLHSVRVLNAIDESVRCGGAEVAVKPIR